MDCMAFDANRLQTLYLEFVDVLYPNNILTITYPIQPKILIPVPTAFVETQSMCPGAAL